MQVNAFKEGKPEKCALRTLKGRVFTVVSINHTRPEEESLEAQRKRKSGLMATRGHLMA